MLSPTCWRNHTFRALLQEEAITPLCVPRISNVTCRGQRQRGSFFNEHWTKLNLLNLTGLRVAFYLDSDVVVQRSLDGVVRTLLHRPTLLEARTPQVRSPDVERPGRAPPSSCPLSPAPSAWPSWARGRGRQSCTACR